MIIILANGKQCRGDLIKYAVLRSDMAPVPTTLEAEIRVDDSMMQLLAEGQILKANGDDYRIIKSVIMDGKQIQGQHDYSFYKVTCLLDSCHQITFIRKRSVIKENATLAQIYRASGATLKTIDADFAVPRFNCYIGGTPSFHIAQILQEEGGIVRWKNGQMKYFRLPDLFKQKPVMTLPSDSQEAVKSEFTERHEVPWFYSINPDGTLAKGNNTKTRTAMYVPFKNEQRLQNMTRCLINRRTVKIDHNSVLCAGDLIDIKDLPPLVIVTAAHAFVTNTDGAGKQQYTKLWLSDINK